MSKWNASMIPDQKGRVIIVTGATSGLGKETARVLAKKKCHCGYGHPKCQKRRSSCS